MVESFSVIDKGVTVEGTILSTGKMVIKGVLRGIITGDTIAIGEEGQVFAEMKAKHITIGGVFEGKLHSTEALVILSTGVCDGKVICKDLVVEAGGVLNAEVVSTTLQNLLPGGEESK